MNETTLRERIAYFAKSLFDRGLTSGTSGNISVRLDDGWLMTPTGASFGEIDPGKLSRLDSSYNLISGDNPTKEIYLHKAMYDERQNARAVVHLHSTHSVAVSCLECPDCINALPALTPYYVMKVGALPIVPYYPPGDLNLGQAVKELASRHHAVLLANHGPVVAGATLDDAVYASEELEETAKLYLVLRGSKTRALTSSQIEDLLQRFPRKA